MQYKGRSGNTLGRERVQACKVWWRSSSPRSLRRPVTTNFPFFSRCFYCQHSKHGHGQQDCSKCGSKGKVNCATCEGHGQIRCYIQLSITWKTNTAEHIIERLDLPVDLIRDVSGQVAYEEEASRVKSIDAFGEDLGIREASTSLVFNHLNSFSDHKVIRQRHQVRRCHVMIVSQSTYHLVYPHFRFE